MASAAAKISFTCPHCDKVLRMSARPAEGKKIKCPACGEAFVPEFDADEEEREGVQERPTLKARGKSAKKADPDEKPRGKKSRADEDDEDDEDEESGPPKNKRKRDDDDDEDEEDEDDRPSKKKKAKQKGGSMMMVVLLLVLGGGFVLSLALVAVGLFVWPGWLRTPATENQVAKDGAPKDAPPPAADGMPMGGGIVNPPPVGGNPGNNLNSYTLPDAKILLGWSMKSLREANQLQPMWLQIEALKGPVPAEIKDLVNNIDSVVMSVSDFGPVPRITVAVLASGPDAVTKLKAMPMMGKEEKLAGKYSVYRPDRLKAGMPPIIAVPSDRVVIIGEMSDQEMTAFLDAAGRNQGAESPAMKLSQAVNLSDFWAVMSFDDNIRAKLRDLDALARENPQFAGAVQALQKANGASMSVGSVGGGWKLQVNLDCADPKDAASVKESGEVLKFVMNGALNQAAGQPGQPAIPASLKGDLESINFQSQGNLASVSMVITKQTSDDLQKLAMMMQNDPFAKGPKDFGPKDLAKGDGFRDFGPKDLPKNDGFRDFGPKDLPKFDGMKKDSPKFDGGSKDKVGQPSANSFTAARLAAGAKEERPFTFQAGKRVIITMTSTGSLKATNVNLHVLQGPFGEKIFMEDVTPGTNGTVTFTVRTTGVYRIRIHNTGPGVASNCVVNIREQ